jgi:predicted DNA-binding protein
MPKRAHTVRFSDEQWERVMAEAERLGLSASDFIRQSVLARIAAPDDGEGLAGGDLLQRLEALEAEVGRGSSRASG